MCSALLGLSYEQYAALAIVAGPLLPGTSGEVPMSCRTTDVGAYFEHDRPLTPKSRKTSINHPTSMLQLVGVCCRFHGFGV